MQSKIVEFPEQPGHPVQKRRKNTLSIMDSHRGSGSNLTWDEAVNIYIRAKQAETDSSQTIQFEKDNLAGYKKIMLEQNIQPSVVDVTIELLREKFVLYMVNTKGYALNTINHRIASIKRFFAFLHREEWIQHNPASLLKQRRGHQTPIYSLTEEQIAVLLCQPDQNTFTGYRDYTMLTLILDTGLRLGEVVKLRLNQMDVKQCFFLGVIGKSKRPRDVPFCDDLRKILLKYLKIRGELPADTLFVTIDGRSMKTRTFQEILQEYGKKAGIEGVRISPHTLRHTFAKMYILNGGDPYSLQEILGHTTQDMVKRYVNLWKPEKKLQHTKASPMRNFYRSNHRRM